MKRVTPLYLFIFCFALAILVLSPDANANRIRKINFTPIPDGPKIKMYFQSSSGDEMQLIAFRDRLLANGASHVHCFLPDLVVCDLPRDVDINTIVNHSRMIPVEPSRIKPYQEGDRAFTLSWLKYCVDRACENAKVEIVDDPGERTRLDGDEFTGDDSGDREDTPLMVPWESVERSIAATRAEAAAQGLGTNNAAARNILQNSEIFMGNVVINLVLPESDNVWGFDWSDNAISYAIGGATQAMLEYVERNRHIPISIVFRPFIRVLVPYEPIYRGITTTWWIKDIVWQLGYGRHHDDPFLAVHAFNNRSRLKYQTDWACSAFIVCSEGISTHRFSGSRSIGLAYLGGPFFLLPYPPGIRNPYGPSNMDRFSGLFLRELLKCFWALYEYQPDDGMCDMYSGYMNQQHLNAVEGIDPIFGKYGGCQQPIELCTMIFNEAVGNTSRPICSITESMIGIVDKNENSIPDIFESPPIVEFEHPEPETLLLVGEKLDVRFKAVATAVPNQNPWQPADERIDFAAPLNWGAYTADALGPVQLLPLDGKWDALEEECMVERRPTIPGYHEVVVQIRNAAGVWSPPYRKVFYILGLRYSPFQVVQDNNGVNLTWSMLGDTFNGHFTLYRIDQDNPSDTLVVDNLKPCGPPVGDHTPYSFCDRSTQSGHDYTYFIRGTCTARAESGESTFVYISPDIEVTGMVPIAETGFISSPVPNPFSDVTYVSVRVPQSFTAQDSPLDLPQRIATDVRLIIYDVLGRQVKDLYSGGVYNDVLTISWDGTNNKNNRVPSGVYFINATSGHYHGVRKVHLVK